MDINFSRSLTEVLKHEGGFINHPKDPGGATNKGITLATFRRYVKRNGTVADLEALTVEQAGKVYRAQYWDAVKGDDLPSGVDFAVFDFAVNSGPARAAKYLQAILGVKQDGVIGPKTIAAGKVRALRALNTVINELCDNRLAFLQRLDTWPTFKGGWTARVKSVRAVALAMALAKQPVAKAVSPAPAPAVPPKPETPVSDPDFEPSYTPPTERTPTMEKEAAHVDIQSGWLSKINWTQMVGLVAMLATVFGIPIDDDLKLKIITFLTSGTAILTIVLRTYFSKSITPAVAKKL